MNDKQERENRQMNRVAAMLLILIAMMIVTLGGVAMLIMMALQ